MGWCVTILLLFVLTHTLLGYSTLRSAPCANYTTRETGICTFNWLCSHIVNGIHIGSCVDRFFVGSCCKVLPQDSLNDTAIYPASTTLSTLSSKRQDGNKYNQKLHLQSEEILGTYDIHEQNQNINKNSNKMYKDSPYYVSQADAVYINNHRPRPIVKHPFYQEEKFVAVSTLNSRLKSVDALSVSQNNAQFSPSINQMKYGFAITYINNFKPAVTAASFNRLKPVTVSSLFDQLRPAETVTSFNQLKPVSTAASFNQLNPVSTAASFNQLKPVSTNKYFDVHKPTVSQIVDNHITQSTVKPTVVETVQKFHLPSFFLSVLQYFQNSNNGDTVHVTTTVSSYTEENLTEKVNHSIVENLVRERTPSNIPFSDENACGISRSIPAGRIVGGKQSKYLKWPWMISLRHLEGKHFKHKCGATLLNNLWAVTAAHCVHKKSPNDILLRLGEYNYHDTDESHPHIERRVYLLVVHPLFDSLTYENDIALLRFYEPIPSQPNIASVCLPKYDEQMEGRIGVVTGWGRLAEEGDLPGYLHEVYLPILNNEECEEMYSQAGYAEKISDVFLCAGIMSGGLDACEGDSGGPIMVKSDNSQWTLAGLISWGVGCALPKQPGVYTRITKFVKWIQEISTF